MVQESQSDSGERSAPRSMSISETQSDDSDWFQAKPKAKKQARGRRTLKKPKTKITKSTFLKRELKKRSKFSKKGRETFGHVSKYHCDECNEDFECGQALGGHMSRVHPGRSDTYQYKVLRRMERAFDRELLRLAKLRHDREVGVGAAIDRVKIRRFKREIRASIQRGERVEGYEPAAEA